MTCFWASPFNNVGTEEDRLGDCNPEAFGGSQIDHEHVLRRLLDRQVAWRGACRDLFDVFAQASAHDLVDSLPRLRGRGREGGDHC